MPDDFRATEVILCQGVIGESGRLVIIEKRGDALDLSEQVINAHMTSREFANSCSLVAPANPFVLVTNGVTAFRMHLPKNPKCGTVIDEVREKLDRHPWKSQKILFYSA